MYVTHTYKHYGICTICTDRTAERPPSSRYDSCFQVFPKDSAEEAWQGFVLGGQPTPKAAHARALAEAKLSVDARE